MEDFAVCTRLARRVAHCPMPPAVCIAQRMEVYLVCADRMPQLLKWEKMERSSSPRLVLISSSSREANAQMDLRSTILIDERFATGSLYGASGTPSAVLIDANEGSLQD